MLGILNLTPAAEAPFRFLDECSKKARMKVSHEEETASAELCEWIEGNYIQHRTGTS